ncbi:MAG: hypothetical protein NTX73_01375 [Rhodobacterales bacterium]|nr:hypothetical protein [Rhodobacterales bacterium]
MRTNLRRILAHVALGFAAAPLAAQDKPLSAIDWLSQSVETRAMSAIAAPRPAEPPIADTAATPDITVSALDKPSPDGIGLLGPDVTGLPANLWSGSDIAELTTLIQAERVETLPAIQDLIVTLMLAKADAPLGATSDGAMFLARVDKLLDLGALEPAQAMLEEADLERPEIFRRWFDVSLLTGTEDAACTMVRDRMTLASTYPARIFCLARNGDWSAAVLTLNTALALDAVTPEEDDLISRFLDPDLFEGTDPLPPPTRPSPLVFRMREGIAEPLPTANLARAFSHADLRPTAPWRNQIEAAERLARSGAVSENVLFGFYMEQTPAASGGIWDRATAIQDFDNALTAGDGAEVAATLPAAFAAMGEVKTEVPFAHFYAPALTQLTLDDTATALLAFRVALLSPLYETAANAYVPTTDEERLWQAVARGDVAGVTSVDPHVQAIIAGFAGAPVPEHLATEIREGQLGEALLRAVSLFNQGLDGDHAALTDAIAVFRNVGLEDTARRAALEYLLLDRPA